MTFPLPDVVAPAAPLAPTLRLKKIKGGETVAVLDFVAEDFSPLRQPTGDDVLAFDWGVRRLLSFVILSRAGEQLTPQRHHRRAGQRRQRDTDQFAGAGVAPVVAVEAEQVEDCRFDQYCQRSEEQQCARVQIRTEESACISVNLRPARPPATG
ncbi:MAG TPA: hypothetical protein ENI37_05340 [Chloroflexi bacterium]|nr:hypothetical protein [Chloroflexota bacterium]